MTLILSYFMRSLVLFLLIFLFFIKGSEICRYFDVIKIYYDFVKPLVSVIRCYIFQLIDLLFSKLV